MHSADHQPSSIAPDGARHRAFLKAGGVSWDFHFASARDDLVRLERAGLLDGFLEVWNSLDPRAVENRKPERIADWARANGYRQLAAAALKFQAEIAEYVPEVPPPHQPLHDARPHVAASRPRSTPRARERRDSTSRPARRGDADPGLADPDGDPDVARPGRVHPPARARAPPARPARAPRVRRRP